MVLILFTESLDVRFTVGIEEFLATLLPRFFELGRCDVPVRPTFAENANEWGTRGYLGTLQFSVSVIAGFDSYPLSARRETPNSPNACNINDNHHRKFVRIS